MPGAWYCRITIAPLTHVTGAPEYFEALVVAAGNPQRCASWVVNDLYSLLNLEGVTMLPPPVTIANFAELLSLIDNNFVSGKQ